MIFKRIASTFFAFAFLMAIVLFTGTGSQYIGSSTARIIFLGAGAIGLVLNLISFRFGKHNAGFNLFFWLGSIVIFIGLTFMMMHFPYSMVILIVGMTIVGLSFIYSPSLKEEDDDELLDG